MIVAQIEDTDAQIIFASGWRLNGLPRQSALLCNLPESFVRQIHIDFAQGRVDRIALAVVDE